jgi:hypothetical protein
MKQKTYQIGVVGGEEDEVTPTNSYMRARSNGSILIPRRQDCNPTDGFANRQPTDGPPGGGSPETCDLGGLKVACSSHMGQATPLRSSGHACYRLGPPAGAQLPLRGPPLNRRGQIQARPPQLFPTLLSLDEVEVPWANNVSGKAS